MTDQETKRCILVTGASGYLGRQVMAELANHSGQLAGLVASDVKAVAAQQRVPGATYVHLDVRDPRIGHVLAQHRVDTVVHLASIVTPPKGMARHEMFEVDVEGTRNVLEACVAQGVRKLIVTSSGAAYGYHADNEPILHEDSPLRGNEAFAYSHHKRLIEVMLAGYRETHPELQQLIFRPGTILGASVRNQITALFEQRFVVGLRGAATPFVFIWDQDVVACIVQGALGEQTGIYNLAGDGVLTLREIAKLLGKRFVPVPPEGMRAALQFAEHFKLTPYGPEQVAFLQYRPVLGNERLKREFGYVPRKTTREVFDLYRRGLPA